MSQTNFGEELPLSVNDRKLLHNSYPLATAFLILLTIINAVLLYQHQTNNSNAEANQPIRPQYIRDYITNSNNKGSQVPRNLQENTSSEGHHHHHDHHNLHSSKCQPFTEDDPSPRILITGGAGVVGGHLISKLKSPPYSYASVKVVDSLHGSGGSTHNLLDPETKRYSINLDKDLCIGDLAATQSHSGDLMAMFRNVDWVIHLASNVPKNGISVPNPGRTFYRKNLQIHSNTISWAAHHNVSLFIFISSMLGYDIDFDRRFNLQDPSVLEVGQVYFPLKNDTLIAYHMSKYMGEYELLLLPSEVLMKSAVLRFHHIYSPIKSPSNRPLTAEALNNMKNRPDYIFLFLPWWDIIHTLMHSYQNTSNFDYEILGEAQQYQDMLYIDDATEAIMRTIRVLDESPTSLKEPLQIGTGTTTTLDNIVTVLNRLIENCLGFKFNPFYFEKYINYRTTGKIALTSKARRELHGWEARTTLAEGLGKVLASFQHDVYAEGAFGELLKSKSECLMNAGVNSSLIMPPSPRSGNFPVLAKPQDVRLETPPGSIFDSLKKVYCEADRKEVLDYLDINIGNVPNKTLIIVLSSTRSHHITWNNFERHLLKALDADLALSVLTEQQGEKMNSFRTNAKYVWEINPPKDNDYMHFYNEIAVECFNHTFDKRYAEIIHSVNYKWSGWLGCIRASKHRACAALIWFFRWFAQQQILNERLYEKYTRIVITRSDYLWVANHASSNLITKKNTIYVPEASDWGGLADRHYMLSTYDAIRSLHLLEAAIKDKDAEKQKQWLKDNEFNYGKGNSEWANLAWHQDVLKMGVVRYQHTGVLVIDPDDPAVNTGFGQRIPEKVSTVYLVKYPDEFEYLRKHNFEGHKKALPDGTLVKGSGKSCFLMEGGNRRPFGGLQAFINNGFDFDQVITITDEDLENLPLGETVY